MTARPIEGLPEVILGSDCLLRHVLQQQKLALHAQQLGKLPEFVGTLRARDRVFGSASP